MEKDDIASMDKVLDFLEDYALTTYQSRCSNYQTVQEILDKDNRIQDDTVKRLLAVCVHDLKEDMKYAVNTLNVITAILNKTQSGDCVYLPELVTAGLSVLNIIKTTALISKVQTLQLLCFDTYLQFPDDTHREIGSNHMLEVMEVFNLYFHQGIPVTIRLLPFNILFKMLKTLPPEQRLTFVKEGLPIWFTKVIPTTMSIFKQPTTNSMVPKMIEVLEMLTEELVNVEYSSNSHWQTILENIYSAQGYPAVMNTLLENGNEYWCRLWNIFVKLLKHQITLNRNKHGSPINFLLPVVELAFKMDYTSRCRAFQCWKVLIDNFATETNENFIIKRIKLLIIPLKLNNAKVEETALAKFDTWWHLIRAFQHRLDKLFEVVFVPFLHFCFGNPKQDGKNSFVPGLLFPKTTRLCLQAFVEAAGHVNCSGCVDVPKLNGRILQPKLMLDNPNDWMHSLQVFTKQVSLDNTLPNKERYLKCVWQSFLQMTCEMSEENRNIWLRKYLELLKQETLSETLFNFITNFITGDQRVWSSFIKDNENTDTSRLYEILRLLLKPGVQTFYKVSEFETSLGNLRQLTDLLVNESKTHNELIEWLLLELIPNENTIILWSALLESIVEGKTDISVMNMKNMLMWPLRNISVFRNSQAHHPAAIWNSSFAKLRSKLSTSVDQEISDVLLRTSLTTSPFFLNALLCIIKYMLASGTDCKTEVELLAKLLAKFKSNEQMTSSIPLIIESLLPMMKKVGEDSDASLAEYTITAVNTTIRLILDTVQSSDQKNEQSANIEKLLLSMTELFKSNSAIKFKCLVVDQLKDCVSVFDEHKSIKDLICSILKLFLKKSKLTEIPFYPTINELIVSLEKNENNSKTKPDNKTNFTTPKVVRKKKKEPSVVNTVVENGEEFVVVKSNWKFNPRKLTENQKEKLQRKREDIPALYQDLSQSQDEFKMTTWKTDSQDTSTSNSASKSNSKSTDFVASLKNMPSTEMVPKIMENIFSDKKSDDNKTGKTNENTLIKTVKATTPVTPKQTRSPRVALKDRVFQNVRNLIEKSNPKEDGPVKELNQTISDPGPKTPTSKSRDLEVTAVYSAPPKICVDRPARVKRKPRKYELDFAELDLKKKRGQQRERNASSDDGSDRSQDNPPDDKMDKEINIEKPVSDSTKDIPKDENKIIEASMEIDSEQVKVDPVLETVDREKTKVEALTTETNKNFEISTDVEIESLEMKGEEIVTNEKDAKETIKEDDKAKTSTKKGPKKSRMIKELAIDMVEGHPFLNAESKGRTTRKSNTPIALRKKANMDKLTKSASKADTKTSKKSKLTEEINDQEVFVKKLSDVTKDTSEGMSTNILKETITTTKIDTKTPNKTKPTNEQNVPANESVKELSEVTKDTHESTTSSSLEEMPMSEDFIESSQDSSITTMSSKSIKINSKKSPKVVLENLHGFFKSKRATETQNILSEPIDTVQDVTMNEAEDIDFSKNKSAVAAELTADFDTEPMSGKVPASCSEDVIIINDDPEPIVLNTENTNLHSETIEIASADTEPLEANFTTNLLSKPESMDIPSTEDKPDDSVKMSETANDLTVTMQNPEEMVDDLNDSATGVSSPFKDDEQRNQDFLNSTLEISPIKTMSPIPNENKSPEPKNDFVVIKLSSPVQINGEPFEKSGSPEIFTEDKISPDKRDLSPPREEISVNSSSPSSSLSLKKNRPQVRQGGRAAQMLGLCVPDNLIMNTERSEAEEPKKPVINSTPARRNLRILYNCGENIQTTEDVEESTESFLKFKKVLPTAECSPSGPILKRKLAEITDDVTVSPASKRKRVSFHDPPVSTTISVQKYIEPLGVRSPQSNKIKRTTRQTDKMKSPKKLENIFKLDTALTKTVESFVDITSDDLTISSLEPTLSVEVVKNDELNDTDPICPTLVNCTDSIKNIASELSSPAMKDLLVKELEGKIETLGDLAKLTELEVNRLCIKAPKVRTAKKALSDYVEKMLVESQDMGPVEQTIEVEIHSVTEANTSKTNDMNMQTDEVTISNGESQTTEVAVGSTHAQTDVTPVTQCGVQTDKEMTWDLVKSYIETTSNIGVKLKDVLSQTAKEELAEDLPLETLTKVVNKKNIQIDDAVNLINIVVDNSISNLTENDSIEGVKRYQTNKTLLLCIKQLLQLHGKP